MTPCLILKSFLQACSLPRLIEGSQEVDISELLHNAIYMGKWSPEQKEVPTTGPKEWIANGADITLHTFFGG